MKKIKLIKISLKIILVMFLTVSINQVLHAADKDYKDYTDIGEINSPTLTIEQVISAPDQYDREVIILDGVISEIEYKTLINGKKFTYFKLIDELDNVIKVYARGYVEDIDDGSKIRIYGRYSKSKKYFFKKYKNVMKARKIQIFG